MFAPSFSIDLLGFKLIELFQHEGKQKASSLRRGRHVKTH